MLSANDGKMINTQMNSRRIKNSTNGVSGVSGPPDINTSVMPISPKATEAMTNILVAIFCIQSL